MRLGVSRAASSAAELLPGCETRGKGKERQGKVRKGNAPRVDDPVERQRQTNKHDSTKCKVTVDGLDP